MRFVAGARLSERRPFAAVLAALVLALLSVLAASGEAAPGDRPVVYCEKGQGPGPVSITTEGPPSMTIVLRRSSDSLTVGVVDPSPEVRPVTCGPGSMALGQITEVSVNNGLEQGTSIVLDQRGGPFEPGAGAEDGGPEVEFDLRLGSEGSADIKLEADGPNRIHLGAVAGRNAADLNGDRDIDVLGLPEEMLWIEGGPFDDVIDATGGYPEFDSFPDTFESSYSGGAGDDRIAIAEPAGGQFHYGGAGDDVYRFRHRTNRPFTGDDGVDTVIFTGGVPGPGTAEPGAADLRIGLPNDLMRLETVGFVENLTGGPAVDRLLGSAGPNRLNARDGVPDVLICGRGRDIAIADARGVDRIRPDCERVVFAPPPGPRLEVLRVGVPPDPRRLGRRGVLVQVLCRAGCRADVELSTGQWAVEQGMPWILGRCEAELAAGAKRWIRCRLRPLAYGALMDDGRPRTLLVRTWVRASFADGTTRQRWVVRRVG